jgi:DNA invertase Pin-like site-specific DNA recombinase
VAAALQTASNRTGSGNLNAIAYFRTSSASNVDGDSEARQRKAVVSYAERAGLELVAEFYDAAVSGADAIDLRPGFRALLASIASNGARKIIVETANRFARDLIVQETGWRYLQSLGIELIAADSPNAFLDDTPTAVLIRQVLGAVAQFEKAALVAKLRAARVRKGRMGGRKPLAVKAPEAVALARSPAMEGYSLREIAALLADAGFTTKTGSTYSASAVSRMLYG